MDLGKQITNLRKEHKMTQEDFGRLFHVTRQTVSNWENRKSFPDLQILVEISNRFDVSLDTLLKGDSKMIKEIDKERVMGMIKHEQSITDFFTGAGTGMVVSCLFSPSSVIRTAAIFVGLMMVGIGWHRKAIYDKKIIQFLDEYNDMQLSFYLTILKGGIQVPPFSVRQILAFRIPYTVGVLVTGRETIFLT